MPWLDVSHLRLFGRLWVKSGKPVYLIHFVTFACVARCPHCFVKPSKVPELSLDDISRLAESVKPAAWALMLTGGEPTLRSDLADIVLAYMRTGGVPYVQIATSGLLPERLATTCENVLRGAPRSSALSVALSLDGVEGEHDRLRGVDGAWEKATATLRYLKSVKDTRLRYLVNITVSQDSSPRARQTYEAITRDLGVENVTYTLTRGCPRDPVQREVTAESLRAFMEHWEAGLLTGRRGYRGLAFGRLIDAQNTLTRRRGLDILTGRRYDWPCYAGRLSGVIWPDGRVSPCEILEETFGLLGDFGMDLGRLWRGALAREFRRRPKPPDCVTCTHECFWLVNVLFNPRLLPRLVALAARMEVATWSK